MEIREQPFRLDERGRRWFDALLAGGLLLPVLLMVASFEWVPVALTLGELLPLFWRRRYPVPVFAVVAAVSAAQAVLVQGPLYGQVAFPVAVYAVARYAAPRWGAAALGVGLAGALVASYVWLTGWGQLGASTFIPYVLTIATLVVTAWALGTLGRTRQAYVDALVERHERLRRESAQQVELAAADERARIAREMHDVVAHGLSMIVVQADGARYVARTDPAAAETALTTIADAGRQALGEMRRMLGLLRSGDSAATRPQPTLADLAALVEETRAGGTAVTARLPGPVTGVPDGVALTTYRIVQEALSNVRRHAGPAAGARVTVDVDPGVGVGIEVVDDGRGAAAVGDGHGLGLAGMRERVEAHGGELETGPLVGGGFRVAARLPL